MTDEQIIKALECCSSRKNCEENCPYFELKGNFLGCVQFSTSDAIDCIRRQQEELKTLDESNAVLFSDLAQEKENYTMMLAKYNAAMAQLGKVRHILAEKCKELDAEKKKVKHGAWKISSDGYYLYCPVCSAEPDSGKLTPYCPNCGAKMNGGPDNGTL